jgi:hypothetical protein
MLTELNKEMNIILDNINIGLSQTKKCLHCIDINQLCAKHWQNIKPKLLVALSESQS